MTGNRIHAVTISLVVALGSDSAIYGRELKRTGVGTGVFDLPESLICPVSG
jgi:hypothetical protein